MNHISVLIKAGTAPAHTARIIEDTNFFILIYPQINYLPGLTEDQNALKMHGNIS